MERGQGSPGRRAKAIERARNGEGPVDEGHITSNGATFLRRTCADPRREGNRGTGRFPAIP